MPPKTTPIIAQYLRVKEKVPDAILFFRLGDFYEMFFEDAELGARVLDIQLTSRSKDGVPLCGVPYHSADPYIARLLKAGHKVAICEQTESSNQVRGLMPRQIVRVMTPGTVNEEMVLESDRKNFLAAVVETDGVIALAALDVASGEFRATRFTNSVSLVEEIARLAPGELLLAITSELVAQLDGTVRTSITRLASTDTADAALGCVRRRFPEMDSLDPGCLIAAGYLLLYLERTFGSDLNHLRPPQFYRANEYLLIDSVSRAHLELIKSSDGGKAGSLLSVLDQTVTPMGARMLSDWILYPLLDLLAIEARHDALAELVDNEETSGIIGPLKQVGDLERAVGRVGSFRIAPRELRRLGQALTAVADLKTEASKLKSPNLRELALRLDSCPGAAARIERTLTDDPPIAVRDGHVIRNGFHPEVDEYRRLSSDTRGVIAGVELRERERTRINTLKVRYNRVFGYYIEVTKSNLERVPADYERKQTLVSAERFTTPELRELERKTLSAESALKELEQRLYSELLRDLLPHTAAMQETARAISELDALLSLASVARRRRYIRPSMNSSSALHIQEGRHPVLETAFKAGEFVPNDLEADADRNQLLLITGPNMAGKSTYLRQVALIVVMAQMGSFVPASAARLGLVDRIFTRIGARDDLRRGESTFMVEMRETARLVSGLTDRSLLLLDEVGRGTSTFDGLAIAWALAEHLHDSTRAKVLFATHFQELTDLARERPRVKNLSVAVREWGGEVVFLHRVLEGAASRSYGIEVARLAGLPQTLISRAREILSNLENGELDSTGMPRLAHAPRREPGVAQFQLFAPVERHVLDELRAVDPDRVTPIDALALLSRLLSRLKDSS